MRSVAFFAIALSLLAAGMSTGLQAYYMVSIAMLSLYVISLLSVITTILTTEVDIRGVKPRVERKSRIVAVFTVKHKSVFPVSAIRVKLSVPSAFSPNQEIRVTSLPFAKKTFKYMLDCPHRGQYVAGITSICVSDLFGLVSLSKRPKQRPLRVDVFPRTPKEMAIELLATDMGPETLSRVTDDTSSPSDVRAWQDGDALKRVHWKLTMRKREVIVRTFEESARPDTLVIPDLSEISATSEQALAIEDSVCEACAGAVMAQLDAGYPVRMPLTCQKPSELFGQSPTDIASFTDALMRVKFDSPYNYEQVLELMAKRAQRTGGAIVVTPYLTTRIADLVIRMKRYGVTMKVIWVTDTRLNQSLELSERLKMDNVEVVRVDPWSDEISA